ncbi:hypothetical protein SKAU_G00147400 [Synaphobranchus kaupii]|uniref:Uncharacterized protein n=1 Tax=Synaphobranchus kaupii TaxID=118154 RepID=A0A9Q1FTU0_SYNKA|nr:hypothetical protein SKAU_G00147400 [Synaphobranchus kaupii]
MQNLPDVSFLPGRFNKAVLYDYLVSIVPEVTPVHPSNLRKPAPPPKVRTEDGWPPADVDADERAAD